VIKKPKKTKNNLKSRPTGAGYVIPRSLGEEVEHESVNKVNMKARPTGAESVNEVNMKARPTGTENKGSILIWTVMLGFILTSVFFFFSTRQRAVISEQRNTAEIISAKNYMESYADYLENLNTKVEMINQEFDGIKVTLTQKTKEITGELDFEKDETYKFTDNIYIEWNACSDKDKDKGNLSIDGTLYETSNGTCSGDGYLDTEGPISVTDPFTIKAPDAPFKYRITSSNDKDITDNTWHLNMEMDLGYGEKIKINKMIKD